MPSDGAQMLFRRALERKQAGRAAWELFDRRVRSPREAMASLPPTPLGRTDLASAREGPDVEQRSEGGQVAYVHVPFCESICSFCGYFTRAGSPSALVDAYVRAVERQVTAWASAQSNGQPLSALQIGGGTPTLLPRGQLVRMVRSLVDAFGIAPGAEITVESTVSHADPGLVSALAEAGVNRVALGVQCFDTALRQSHGRRATKEQVLGRITEVREAGVENVNLDLIYGLPAQSFESWRADLDEAIRCGATGLSIYPLVPFPSSRLVQAAGDRAPMDVREEHRCCTYADETLGAAGWRRLTPVQYAKGVDRASYVCAQHRGADVVAVGPGAAGRLGSLVYANAPDLEAFVRGGSDASRWLVTAFREDGRHEAARSLHLLGTPAWQADRVPAELRPTGALARECLLDLGLLASEPDGDVLTSDGCFWAGNICAELTDTVRAHFGSSMQEAMA